MRKIYFRNNIKTYGFFKGLFLNLKLWFKMAFKPKQCTFTADEIRFMLIIRKLLKNLLTKEGK